MLKAFQYERVRGNEVVKGPKMRGTSGLRRLLSEVEHKVWRTKMCLKISIKFEYFVCVCVRKLPPRICICSLCA